MLFEVPGLSLGAPKTESKKSVNKNTSEAKEKSKRSKNIEKDAQFFGSDYFSKSKVKAVKDTPTESSFPKRSSSAISDKFDTSNKSTVANFANKIKKESGKSKLQQKMEEKLRGARFRYLNQKLYQSHSHEALNHFQEHPEDFQKVNFIFVFNSYEFTLVS